MEYFSMTRDELITALEKAEADKKIAVAIEAESQALMAEEFTRLASEDSLPTNAVPRCVHYMTRCSFFSISAFPDKPFVTFDIRAICWNLKSEARSGRRRSIHHEGMPHRIFR
jgi:hypothetical protein